jgi:thiamine biosynthesis protein ThiI
MGELTLKKNNKRFFERCLKENLKQRLRGIPNRISYRHNRLHLSVEPEYEKRTVDILSKTFGVSAFVLAYRVEKQIEEIEKAALRILSEEPSLDGRSFKIEAKRTDKSFPIHSYDICVRLGTLIENEFPGLTVDVHNPDITVQVEIRKDALVSVNRRRGARGLPVGAAGKAMLLLSGGIDSPVAGFLMARRGLIIEALHFDAYPFTSEESREKVKTIARILGEWDAVFRLFTVPLTEIQMKIRKKGPEKAMTLFMRAAMMKIAELIALRRKAKALITGESLSQVASQTIESLHFSNSMTRLPVFRPLIGMDKEEITTTARQIGTYKTSILPYEDCCTLFTPRHPLIRPEFDETVRLFEALEIEEDIQKTADAAESVQIP